MSPPSRRAGLAAALGGGALLASCAVGPDFAPPPPSDAKHILPDRTGSPGEGQRFAEGKDISAEWWTLYKSKPLDELVKESLQNNPSLQASEAAVRIAYFNAEAQKGGFFPQVLFSSNDSQNIQSNNRSLGAINQTVFNQSFPTPGNAASGIAVPNVPTNTPNAPYGLFLKQLTVSFTPDVWGGNARAVESLVAQTEQQNWQLEAAHLALTSNVVVAAIQEASIRGQIEATKNIIAILHETLEILNRQYSFGSIAKADVVAQEAELAQFEQTLPPLEKQLEIQRNLLTALAGRLSFEGAGETFELKKFVLPSTIPVSVPSKLVAQRPDVRAAEANLHQASAAVGVAIANRLPNITLSANVGASAFHMAQLFAPGTGLYTAAANISQPVFDGMTLLNKQKAAEAALEQADAQYRDTVVHAFENVADALRALQSDAKAVQTARKFEDAAKRSLDIVRMQVKYGQVSQLAVLNAQRTYFTASVSRVQAEATRLSDTAALFMALGGGWWNR
ncbi:efflux transporter outer membrane subunit [Methylocystis parvus]|uniref:Efflux transporter outer membrane subunit n=1 Tax=Methylocystis parvus TaxID=134 RepID=A0A6B8M4N1_9HYPH|nr:efflux transporter outer membrane subunit [Methylocystis parvus]QGM97336.1 efflux transporter outer membrane subunit [Methylocystis parvus]WBJ98753.1 efflux transporter outer membrane subunit [Methylocystis parvus OBBP]